MSQYFTVSLRSFSRILGNVGTLPLRQQIVRRPLRYRTFGNSRRPPPINVLQPVDKLAAFTRDEDIDTLMVQLKTDDGGIEAPQLLENILQTIDRKTQCVIQLSKRGERDAAIVEIRSKEDLLKQIRDKENQTREAELAKRQYKPKQIELNWAISENDLGIKLKQMESFLEKGRKVEILLASKRRQRKASEEEGNLVLKKIKESLEAVGAKEIKPMEGQVLKQALMIVKKT